jgi:hypothetical protein
VPRALSSAHHRCLPPGAKAALYFKSPTCRLNSTQLNFEHFKHFKHSLECFCPFFHIQSLLTYLFQNFQKVALSSSPNKCSRSTEDIENQCRFYIHREPRFVRHDCSICQGQAPQKIRSVIGLSFVVLPFFSAVNFGGYLNQAHERACYNFPLSYDRTRDAARR